MSLAAGKSCISAMLFGDIKLTLFCNFSNLWFSIGAYFPLIMKNLTVISLTLIATALSGCTLTSAGVKKGDERNFVRSLNDVSAGRVIKARMDRAENVNLKGVDVEVREGIVVLTGNVPTQDDRVEAERIAWSSPDIDQIGNEIFVKDKQSATRNFKDGLLEKSVRARLTADKYVKSRNLNVETHDGIVYLLGVARNEAELERAAQIASETKGTAEVISYVTVAGIPSAISELTRTPVTQSVNPVAAPYAEQSYNAPSYSSQQRSIPGVLSAAPSVPSIGQPVEIPSPYSASSGLAAPSGSVATAPLSAPIPFTPQAQPLQAPTAPAQLSDMGDRLNKEFPTDDELGRYRTGAAGEAVSIIESEPYYLDPETGKQIPVSFLKQIR